MTSLRSDAGERLSGPWSCRSPGPVALTDDRPDASAADLASLAECYDELNRPDEAATTMLRLYAGHPEDADIRRAARLLAEIRAE